MRRKHPTQFRKGVHVAKGFVLTWTDYQPKAGESSIKDAKVTHKNPVLRSIANSVWADYHEAFINRRALLWRTTLTAFFPYAKGEMERKEQVQVVERAVFHDIAVAMQPHLDALCDEGVNLDRVEFVVECLGDRQPRDSDYEDGYEK